ncbi:hypothetical protein [Aquimonas sp.]|jgi:hypothetical protein|uniref:hypothetical protein n=1 Tax=Aquimonas sp. TaxID=1872588 RepID=UPI0037C0E87A
MGCDLVGDDDSIASRLPAMPSRPLPLSLAASLLSPAGLADALEDQLGTHLDAVRPLPRWLDLDARAAAAWALIALGHGVPEAVVAQGFDALRETCQCGEATRLGIGIDCALSMMAEALRDHDLAGVAWATRFGVWREQRARQVAA